MCKKLHWMQEDGEQSGSKAVEVVVEGLHSGAGYAQASISDTKLHDSGAPRKGPSDGVADPPQPALLALLQQRIGSRHQTLLFAIFLHCLDCSPSQLCAVSQAHEVLHRDSKSAPAWLPGRE